MIRKRQVSSVEVVKAHIERIKVVNPRINAVVQLAEEQALKRAREADQALARGNNWGLALALPILAGPSPGDPFALHNPPLRDRKKVNLENLHVVFYTDNGIVKPTSATEDTIRNAAKTLSEVASVVEEKRPPRIEESYDLFVSLFLPGAAETFQQQLRAHGTERVSPLVEQFLRIAREYEDERNRTGKPIDPDEREIQWRTFNQTMAAFMSDYDVMLCPVNAYPAMKHGTTWDQVKAFSYLMTYNLTGHPAAVVRCGTSPEGLPIGVQIVGQLFREDVAFAVAEQLENALGGWQPPPL